MSDFQQVLEERPRPAASPSVTSLVRGIVSDVERLLEQQLALAQHELQQDLRQTCQAAWLLAIGVGHALLGGVALLFGIAYGVSWLFPSVPIGGSFAILGMILAVIAWGVIDRGLKKFRSLNLRFSDSTPAKEQQNGRPMF